ncbi:sigma-54-dependent transcriptional regulator [Cognatishimia activa]|uniref:Sigma-54-dependent Fis family transcriptional regulator n=1 Tax=Cognatishimia activa TaxID=1715691 RepID=A0A975ENA4_9RHOB|nr:sigma-54 dependent transcriptional regulator [Cognatishimia activa]QTN35205.1 sigma-54-dependent Fis family transcriptional regulator [Cognatishimia activa]
MSKSVLLVDDDRAVRDALGQTLMLDGYDVTLAASYIEAKDHITPDFGGVIVSDIRMPGKDGFDLLAFARGVDADLPVVLLTGEGDIPMAVRGLQAGAFNFLEKPCETQDFLSVVENALRSRQMVMENRVLKQKLEQGDAASRLLFGTSDLAEGLRAQARKTAKAGTNAMIFGAPGSGNFKVAEVVHLLSEASSAAFEKRTAAGLTPETLSEALKSAEGGTLFLDEISTLRQDVQFALNDALDAPNAPIIIGGTYESPEFFHEGGNFNSDLFYRLNVMTLRVPSLKERPEDIPDLFRHYVNIAAEQAGTPAPEVTPETISTLMAQDWPGNARALMNAAMRFTLGVSDGESGEDLGLAEQLARVERSLLTDALKRFRGNATEAAKALKLPRKTFYDKLTRHEIRAELYR